MTTASPRAVSMRFLGVLALLLGVLAMHGLSMGHDPASMSAEMSMATPAMGVVDAVAADVTAAVQATMPAPSDGHLAHLGAVCVAVLTGGLSFVLLLLLLGLAGRLELNGARRNAGVVRTPAYAAPPPRPSLTMLCLSRT